MKYRFVGIGSDSGSVSVLTDLSRFQLGVLTQYSRIIGRGLSA